MSAAAAAPPSIFAPLDRLRRLSQIDGRGTWQRCPAAADPPDLSTWRGWPLAALSDRGHIVWPQGQKTLWLHQNFTWPSHLHGYPLEGLRARLALRWWAHQADIFVDGQHRQSGDIFDCWTRVELSDWVVPGETVAVTLQLVSPGHDPGALVEATVIFEMAAVENTALGPEPGFVADELAVLATYLERFQPDQVERVSAALEDIDWSALGQGTGADGRDRFHHSLQQVRQALRPFSPWLKQRTIHCLGHAHLDLAWLWPVADTWAAAERTFRSVLALQQDYPELTFSHSSPALFAWLEQHRPELFAAVQGQVQAGHWAIDAGLWVEPDLNLPGGEAIARQILYGQRYCAKKFGAPSAIAWLPDTFGFSWQLPQLLTQGGIRYFATQKLRWNDTNPFPHDLFAWQGRDGTAITGVTLPPIGTDIDPVAMAQYACAWEASTGLTEALWLPGVGDHGGGPTRTMLQTARRWARSPFFPSLTWGHAVPLLDRLLLDPGDATNTDSTAASPPASPPPVSQQFSNPRFPQGRHAGLPLLTPSSPHPPISPSLPPWRDELYLELHRGCYTTHADQKQSNRRCEDTLFQAELFASIAALQGLQPYPQAELEAAWKRVLFNQFHDILPGTSIPEVFEQANGEWQVALATGDRILQRALAALAQRCPLPAPPHPEAVPVVLFNPLNWPRQEVVAIARPPAPGPWQAQDAAGTPLPTQPTPAGSLLVYPPPLPPVGYGILWLVPAPAAPPPVPPSDWVLENDALRATLDPATGQIASLIHRATGHECFEGGGNRLQAFQDRGQYWDAWNLAPDYRDHPLPGSQVEGIEWVECGPVRQVVRVVHRLGQSRLSQDYCLEVGSPLLAVHTQVDWQETQVVLKVAFPLTVSAPAATYAIPYGAIARATEPVTPQDGAKWEVPALDWADLSDGDRGVSILTDYKHGFDATPSQLRLTLLKAPLWPDPGCDRGSHSFRYAIYPHRQGWQQAQTVRLARSFNLPILPWVGAAGSGGPRPTDSLPTAQSFLDLGDSSVVLSALKQAEDGDHYILRGYESAGAAACLTLGGSLGFEILGLTDGLEQVTAAAPEVLALRPWQVVSLAVSRGQN